MKPDVAERLAIVIRRARNGKSQRAYAEDVGLSWTAIQAWEKGKRMPERDSLVLIAKSLGVTIDEILAYVEQGVPPRPVELDQILTAVRFMPPSQLAVVGKALAARWEDPLMA